MVLLPAQGMPVAKIAEVTFTSTDRVREVIHNFNADGFDSLYPKYSGGRPKRFTLSERREIKKIAKSRPAEHGLPFSTWSLAKLADFLVTEGVVDDVSHEGLRVLPRQEGVSFQRVKTWKTSHEPDYATKKAGAEHLYAIADGEVIAEEDEPEAVSCLDEFWPLNLRPHPGRQWAERGGRHEDPGRQPTPRRRATYTGPHGSGTCSPPTTWAPASFMATSNRRRTARSSWSSAAICAASTSRYSISADSGAERRLSLKGVTRAAIIDVVHSEPDPACRVNLKVSDAVLFN